jgi:hypothetical protein
MLKESTVIRWAGIEHEELDSENWVQMGYRFWQGSRIYLVFGEIRAEHFKEEFYTDNTKTMAYDFYYEKVAILENGCVYCAECGKYATSSKFASSVSQTGFCPNCAP